MAPSVATTWTTLYGATIGLPTNWIDQSGYIFVPAGEGKRYLAWSFEPMGAADAVKWLETTRQKMLELPELEEVTPIVTKAAGVGVAHAFAVYFGREPESTALAVATIARDTSTVIVRLRCPRHAVGRLDALLTSLAVRGRGVRQRSGRYSVRDLAFDWEGTLATPTEFSFVAPDERARLEVTWAAEAPTMLEPNWSMRFVFDPEGSLRLVERECGPAYGGQDAAPGATTPHPLCWEQALHHAEVKSPHGVQSLVQCQGYLPIEDRFLCFVYRAEADYPSGLDEWRRLLAKTHVEA